LARGDARRVTGERVSTAADGFNPTWQRHVAAYEQCAPLLPDGRVLDVGCGVGHSYELLAPRETIGIDIDPGSLEGQARETRVGDMRALPFADASFSALLSVQAIEHVPDPERALAEARRVLEPGGVAIFVTPNRLTFGPPDEVIDPYHHLEFSPDELRACCASVFDRVELSGLFGSPRYLDLVAAERASLDRLLRMDPLGIRRAVPRWVRKRLYDWALRRRRAVPDSAAAAIEPSDFELRDSPLAEALDVVAVCSLLG
jgi:SAM-dependent methyltransferase